MGTLHLVNGDSAAGALVASGLARPPQVLVLHDVLSCGRLAPLAKAPDDPAWLRSREDYWRAVWSSARSLGLVERAFPAFYDKPRNIYTAREALLEADRVILYGAAGLSDRLHQALMLAWLKGLGVSAARCWLAFCEGAGDDSPPRGLAHRTPAQLAAELNPAPATPAQGQLLAQFLEGYTGDDPQVLDALRQSAPAWLAPALTAWFHRWPGPLGLDAWDERLLRVIAAGADRLPRVLGGVLNAHAGDPDPVGDLVLAHRLQRLASQERALVTLAPNREASPSVHLSEAGRAVLRGEAIARPSEDWIGGIPIAGEAAAPFQRKGDALVRA